MNPDDFRKLAAVVNRPEWDMFLVWVDSKRVESHDKLETVSPDNLKGVQGELRIIKEILTLRKTVNSIMSAK